MTAPAASPGPLSVPLPWDLVARGYADENTAQFERYAGDAIRLAELGSDDVIVDIAAGPGSLVVPASRRVKRIEALDFSEAMLNELRARLAEKEITNVTVCQGDGQALPYPDASFSAAFSMFGLMFFPDRTAGFREMRRVLDPGGRAVVSSWQPMTRVPLLVAVFRALSAELPSIPFGDGKGPLSDPADLEAEMKAGGFEVTVHEVVHSIEVQSLERFWAALRRGLAPLVLIEHKMGAEAFAPVAEGMRRRLLEEFGNGPQSIAMPAWLALGRAR